LADRQPEPFRADPVVAENLAAQDIQAAPDKRADQDNPVARVGAADQDNPVARVGAADQDNPVAPVETADQDNPVDQVTTADQDTAAQADWDRAEPNLRPPRVRRSPESCGRWAAGPQPY